MIELDQDGNVLEGTEAVKQKIAYIAGIESGELPYSTYGLPTRYFSTEVPKIKKYIESRLEANGITAVCNLTEQGRLTVFDTDIIAFEGDI